MRKARLAGAGIGAALAGAAGCAGLPEGSGAHPDAGQAATPFTMAEKRCAAQGMSPAVLLQQPIRDVRIGGHQLYRGASLGCE